MAPVYVLSAQARRLVGWFLSACVLVTAVWLQPASSQSGSQGPSTVPGYHELDMPWSIYDGFIDGGRLWMITNIYLIYSDNWLATPPANLYTFPTAARPLEGLYCSSRGTLFVSARGNGVLYRSTNRGLTFTPCFTFPVRGFSDAAGNGHFNNWSFDEGPDGTLYLGQYHVREVNRNSAYLYWSDDDGVTWQDFPAWNRTLATQRRHIHQVKADRFGSGRVWWSVGDAQRETYYSDDRGQTFYRLLPGRQGGQTSFTWVGQTRLWGDDFPRWDPPPVLANRILATSDDAEFTPRLTLPASNYYNVPIYDMAATEDTQEVWAVCFEGGTDLPDRCGSLWCSTDGGQAFRVFAQTRSVRTPGVDFDYRRIIHGAHGVIPSSCPYIFITPSNNETQKRIVRLPRVANIPADPTPPTPPVIADDGAFTRDLSRLSASWTSSDPESGLVELQYAIGTSPVDTGTGYVVPWQGLGTNLRSWTETGLSLTPGSSYYWYVRARNAAGLWSSTGASDGIVVDITPPETGIVSGPAEGSCQASGDAAFAFEATDGLSIAGVLTYSWQLDDGPWSGFSFETAATLAGLADGSHTFRVRARDAAGNTDQTPAERSFTVNTLPPAAPVVADDGDFTTSTAQLHAAWSVADPSAVSEWQYAIGTSAADTGSGYLVDWRSAGTATEATESGLDLQEGQTYYWYVRARNAAGLWSSTGASDGIMVEAVAPDTQITAGPQAGATIGTPEAAFAFVAIDDMSIAGVLTYSWQLDDGPWSDFSFETAATLAGLSDGPHTFRVRARDAAGNTDQTPAERSFTVNTLPPAAPVVADDGDFTASTAQLHASWSSVDPESGIPEYRYAIGTSPSDPESGYLVDWRSAATATEATEAGLDLQEGQTYYWYVRARNTAGLWSSTGASDGIMVDITPPDTGMLSGPAEGSCQASGDAAFAFEATDGLSIAGVLTYSWQLDDGPWSVFSFETAATLAGLADGSHIFRVRARDAAGNTDQTPAERSFTVNTLPPAAPVVVDDGDFTASTAQLHASWSSVDPESGIAEYRYAIGTSPSDPESGYLVDWRSAATATEATEAGLELHEGQTYYWYVRARNTAGLWSGTGASDGIMVEAVAPDTQITAGPQAGATIGTPDAAFAFAATDDLSIAGVLTYSWQLDDGPWSDFSFDTTATLAGLADGSHTFRVRARDAAGNTDQTPAERSFTVNTLPPAAPIVADDGDFTTSTAQLHAAWSVADPSSVSEWQYAIGASAADTGSGYLVDWRSAATATEATETGLDLQEGQAYYWYVRARSADGLWSGVGVSDGIMVDITPPDTGMLSGPAEGSCQASGDAAFAFEATDGLSITGALTYSWQLDDGPWSVFSFETAATLAGLADGSHTFRVRARDAAGNTDQTPAERSFTVNTLPPAAPVVADDGDFTTSTAQLHASWSSVDPESGIADYRYAIGTSPSDPESGYLVDWRSAGTATEATEAGLELHKGQTYYWYVRARNAAGLWSSTGVSDGIMVEAVAPDTQITAGPQAGATIGTPDAAFAFAATDDLSIAGVLTYSWQLDDGPWSDFSSETAATLAGLADGSHIFRVRARDAAGNTDQTPAERSFTVNTLPPPAPVVADDGDFTASTAQLHASWSSVDPESGIAEYRYAIGTSPSDPESGYLVDWRSAATATEATMSGLDLQEGQTYYWYVRARNAAGLWSSTGASNGIMVEAAAHETPSTAKLHPNDERVVIEAVVTANAAESGGRMYVEAPDRSGGVAVISSTAVLEGDVVVVHGTMTTLGCERALSATMVRVAGHQEAIAPVGMSMRTCAGGSFFYDALTGRGQRGATEPPGLGVSTTGLLVRVFGRVVSADDTWLFVTDGISPGGIRVSRTNLPEPPPMESIVQITGISSLRQDGDGCMLVILPRRQGDLRVLLPEP